jgi:hypothetical protein
LRIVVIRFLTVALPALPYGPGQPKLPAMEQLLAELAELAADSGPWYQVPDADLVRLTAAARAAGHRWAAIDNACDHGPGKDIPAVIRQQYWFTPLAGRDGSLLSSARPETSPAATPASTRR